MNKLTIVSYFRNSTRYIYRYFSQIKDLEPWVAPLEIHLLLGEGDSTDNTKQMLLGEAASLGITTTLVDVSHGGPEFRSVVDEVRFKNLAHVTNTLWKNLPLDTDIVLYVESDLQWRPESLYRLVQGLQDHQMRAPMVFTLDGRFYDTWGFQMAGERFKLDAPYHPQLKTGQRLYTMDTVGSCFVSHYQDLACLTWPEDELVRGVCSQFKEQGGEIILDVNAKVYHP
jgi:hypothetical protein